MMKMLLLAILGCVWMALTVTPVPASPIPSTSTPSQIQENVDVMSTVQSASHQSQLVATETTPTSPIPATDQKRTEDSDIQSTASLPNANPSPVSSTTSSNSRSLNSSSSEIAAAQTTLKPFAPPFPKSKDPRIKYEMIVLNDEDPEDHEESTTEATAVVQPTRYWDQYDLSEWNKRQRIKMRAHQELFHRLHHGKEAPPMDSAEMMDVIPDYGEGIHYSEDDLKNMGIKKRVD